MTNFGEYLMVENIKETFVDIYYTISDTLIDSYRDEISIKRRNECCNKMTKKLAHLNKLIKSYYNNTVNAHESLDTLLKINKHAYKQSFDLFPLFINDNDPNKMSKYLFNKKIVKGLYSFIVKVLSEDSVAKKDRIDSIYLTSKKSQKLIPFIYQKVGDFLNNLL